MPESLQSVTGQKRKALVEFANVPSIRYVIEAAKAAGLREIVVVGGEDVAKALPGIEVLPEGESAIDNAAIGSAALSHSEAVLFLPSDSPRIEADSIAHFTRTVDVRRPLQGDWFAAGLCHSAAYALKYPGAPFKPIRLRGMSLLSGALYAASPGGVSLAKKKLQAIRHNRKSQIAMLLRLGIGNILRYATGRIDIVRAEKIVAQFLGAKSMLVTDCGADTCLDFDDATEYEYVKALFDSP